VSITRRLIDLAKSNLNALLDRVGDGERDSLDEMSDQDLEAELKRRREDREVRAAEDAQRQRERAKYPAGGTRENKIAQYYAQLEVPYGSDLETVKQSYRRLMRKYHPDLHSGNADKQKVATELAQALSRAYNELEQVLKARR
jgi:DnaJ-domain-containing protein 1